MLQRPLYNGTIGLYMLCVISQCQLLIDAFHFSIWNWYGAFNKYLYKYTINNYDAFKLMRIFKSMHVSHHFQFISIINCHIRDFELTAFCLNRHFILSGFYLVGILSCRNLTCQDFILSGLCTSGLALYLCCQDFGCRDFCTVGIWCCWDFGNDGILVSGF